MLCISRCNKAWSLCSSYADSWHAGSEGLMCGQLMLTNSLWHFGSQLMLRAICCPCSCVTLPQALASQQQQAWQQPMGSMRGFAAGAPPKVVPNPLQKVVPQFIQLTGESTSLLIVPCSTAWCISMPNPVKPVACCAVASHQPRCSAQIAVGLGCHHCTAYGWLLISPRVSACT